MKRILLIEDQVDAAETMRFVLETGACQVEVATSGQAGLRAALEQVPELVLCDLHLPDLDGLSVALALRADPRTRQTRLIALTGCSHPEDRRQAEAAGFDTLLVKPVSLQVLRRLCDPPDADHPNSSTVS